MRTRMLTLVLLASSIARGGEPPPIPVGLDALRQWERWPCQRIGAPGLHAQHLRSHRRQRGCRREPFPLPAGRRLQRHARRRGPRHPLLRALQPLARQPLALRGGWHRPRRPGDAARPTRTSPSAGSVFLPREPFPEPLAWTWSTTRGADLSWVPMPFERSFRMAYSRTHYGTGYYIYHQFVPGARLSRPIRAWDGKTAARRGRA